MLNLENDYDYSHSKGTIVFFLNKNLNIFHHKSKIALKN